MAYRSMELEEVAAHLHLTPAEVLEYVKTNEIPHEHRGGRAIFVQDEIDAWASKRILEMGDQKLVAYHAKTTLGTRSILDQDALMPDLISTEYINLTLQSKTKHSVIEDMVGLAQNTNRVLDIIELRQSVEEREDLCSTALPGGIALLHSRNHDAYRFDGSFMVFGRSIQDVPFGAPDGGTSRLFFLLCCQDDHLHLHTLARLCLMIQKTDMIERLYCAETPDEVYHAIVACELAALVGKKHPEPETPVELE
jgi:PTS system nitrogen regulatory IIA component